MITIKAAMRRRRLGSVKFSFLSAGYTGFGTMAINSTSSVLYTFTPPILSGYTGVTDPDDWSMFTARQDNIAALKSDGSLWTCGRGNQAQLGLGLNNLNNSAKLTKVEVIENSAVKSDWVFVGCGTSHTLALDASGKIWAVGDNQTSAQLGNGNANAAAQPGIFYNTNLTPEPHKPAGLVFKAIRAGHRFNMGMDVDNEIWTWGNNGGYRQCGRWAMTAGRTRPTNTPIMAAYPTLIPGSIVTSSDPDYIANSTMDTNWRKIDQAGPWLKMFAGGYHAGAIHATTGEFWSWGNYDQGQRGSGPAAVFAATSDKDEAQKPTIIPMIGGKRWVDCTMGENTTILINEDGVAYAAGSNQYGELGLGGAAGTTVSTFTPIDAAGSTIPVGGLTWKSISTDWFHTVAVHNNGTLWSWGQGSNGKLGSGSTSNRSLPAQVGTDSNWAYAVAALETTTAIKTITS